LARGLVYYTGMIFEAEYVDEAVGSVVGGGRYDNLTENMGGRGLIPCVGFSVGITRIFTILSEKYKKESSTMVYVGASGRLFLEERLSILRRLRESGISSETFYTGRASFGDQQMYCVKKGIPFIAVIGESELTENSIQVVDVSSRQKEIVPVDDMVEYFLRSR